MFVAFFDASVRRVAGNFARASLSKLEMNQKDIERLYAAIAELRGLMLEKFQHVNTEIHALREHTNLKIQALSDRNDQQFAELRREINVNMRWMMGMWFATLGLLAGMAGRTFGLY